MPNEILDATKTAFEDAIAFSIAKSDINTHDEFINARLHGDCYVCDYFRYGLAKALAEFLGSMEKQAKAIYVYDSLDSTLAWDTLFPNQPNLSTGIHMLIWTRNKSAALKSLVDSLAKAVSDELSHLSCPKANALCHQVDITIVDDHEVENREGYGALIHSLYLRPIEMWHREAVTSL
jgi:hypothetical protein